MNVYTISLFSHLMIMFCFYYLLTVRQPLEVADKNCLFDRYLHVRFSLLADLTLPPPPLPSTLPAIKPGSYTNAPGCYVNT